MTARTVILVTGPPCAGKTTYVRDRARPGDTVLDQDDIGPARMRAELARVAAMTSGRTWVIRCCPTETARRQLAASLDASVVLLWPGTATLMARARARATPGRHVQAVRHWLAVESGRRPANKTAGDPAPWPRTTW